MPATTENRLHLSQTAPTIIQSEIRSMTVECDAVGGVNLAQGVCDTPLPTPVLEAAIQAILDGYNIYTRLDGIAVLRQAIAEKLARHNGMSVDPEKEVLVASGATGAMYSACLALFDPGDQVILFEPFYGYHYSTLRSIRVEPILVPMEQGTWEIDFDRLRGAITPRTRAIVINSPGNPCGKVFSRAELEAIAALAIEFDLFVLTDEIYEYFVYEGQSHISPATLPGMAERTISISGFSKTFSMTGWRMGYLTASSKWMPAIGYFHDLGYVCAPSPFQHAAAAGLRLLPDSFYQDLATEYGQKRDKMCDALAAAGLTPAIPAGAYYVLADATRIEGDRASVKARNLLRATGVAAVAGSAFYGPGKGENLLRYCFAKQDADLERACTALRNFGV
ncbi:MAG TPA: aminotransferase class I/II-fold pyridoxal phosphate-dependent enzyme [Acidobacteriaceae bacterium]|nr:aminotransferase class I/II-fold pyridoxal phosphate-dependent enzyme [Acidobacteriaceae bacterium]